MDAPPVVAYFDMNVWVALAKGLKSQDRTWVRRYALLADAVEASHVVVPLTTGHYLELWHRSSQESREDIGRVMQRVSRFATLAPIQTVLEREVEAHVARLTGGDARVGSSQLLGYGASHAFSSPHGRFRFVESLASDDGSLPEGGPVDPPPEFVNPPTGAAWEWIQLVGLPEVLESLGVDRTPSHRLGTAHAEEEVRIRELMAGDPRMRGRLRDFLIADVIMSLSETINDVCERAGISSYALLLDHPEHPTPPEAMGAFISELPAGDAFVTLRERKHRDTTHPWDQHDRIDLQSLATTLPYVDVIITERRWAHLCNASGLARRHQTSIYPLHEFDHALQQLAVQATPEA
ncbi:hypothetical protein [Nocardioides zeae]|uniref:hypothetical protein n=1 Tax=Nocardioides zeae TaxID=1457234 RepID=UPI00286CB19B|nr:hypothetical protein [Nocardioides zeae]